MPRAMTPAEKRARVLETGKLNKTENTIVKEEKTMTQTPEKVVTKVEQRKERIPLGVPRKKLEAKEIPGYHLHWVNDYPGRVQEALQSGYEFVSEEETAINDFVTPGNSDLGTRVKRMVGKDDNGGALFAYLMKINEDLWKQDQEELQKRNNLVDEAIRRGDLNPVSNQYGSVKIS